MASAISELQNAFGTILKVEKSRPTILTPPESYPKWTGALRLFDFPREMRDRIYLHALHRSKGYVYKRNSTHSIDLWKEDETHTNLYLTSKQVHDEALEVFYRYNALTILYTARLAGTLRLFPQKPAQLLQRIRLNYRQDGWRNDWLRISPSGCFAQQMIEARVAKSFLPLLRDCTAVWTIGTWAFEHQESMNFSNKTHTESVHMLLDWMQRYYFIDGLVPPSYLKVEITQYYAAPELEGLEKAFAEALEKFKVWARETQRDDEDSEAKGRKWVEEALAVVPLKRVRRRH